MKSEKKKKVEVEVGPCSQLCVKKHRASCCHLPPSPDPESPPPFPLARSLARGTGTTAPAFYQRSRRVDADRNTAGERGPSRFPSPTPPDPPAAAPLSG